MSANTSSTPAKVVLMIRNVQPYDFGGGERIPVHLAEEIRLYGYDTVLVSKSPKVLAYAQSHQVRTIRGWWWARQNWSGRNNLLLPLYVIWQLLLTVWYVSIILRTHAAIVHPQGRDDFIAATLAAKLLGRRVVWSDYADLKYVYENHNIWYKNPIGRVIYYLSRWTRAVILTSHSDESLILAALGKKQLPEQYVVVYNGVVDRAIPPAERKAEEREAFVYCATSRLVTAKGIAELVRAFNRLNQEFANTRLWLVGDGPEAEEFKTLAADNQAITFYGHVDAPLPLVAACDIFVHPSYLEGFSISLIEAAMLARPMIACDVGGNPEIIFDHKTGLLVKDRDDESLYQAMKLLYTDRDLATKLGQEARKQFEDKLQFDKLVREQFVPLYEKA